MVAQTNSQIPACRGEIEKEAVLLVDSCGWSRWHNCQPETKLKSMNQALNLKKHPFEATKTSISINNWVVHFHAIRWCTLVGLYSGTLSCDSVVHFGKIIHFRQTKICSTKIANKKRNRLIDNKLALNNAQCVLICRVAK